MAELNLDALERQANRVLLIPELGHSAHEDQRNIIALIARVRGLEKGIDSLASRLENVDKSVREALGIDLDADDALPNLVAEWVDNHATETWQPLTAAGQLSEGDRLYFTIGDTPYLEIVRGVLDAGTDREEIVYNLRRNFYFITSMAVDGRSSHKNVKFISAAPRAVKTAAIAVDSAGNGCDCRTCSPISMNMRMVLCPTCGNKRCPRANDHRNACTGSNEPGQPGSAYPTV